MIEQIATSSNFQSTLQQTQPTTQTNSAIKSTKSTPVSSNLPPPSSSPFNYNLNNYLNHSQPQNQQQQVISSKQAPTKDTPVEFQPHFQQQNLRYPTPAGHSQSQNQFGQPSFSTTFDQNNWQAAYSKYPLTFLPTPPQFSQQNSNTSNTTNSTNTNNGSSSFNQKPQPVANQQINVFFFSYNILKHSIFF